MKLDDILREATRAKATDIYLIAGAVPCMSIEGQYLPLRVGEGHRADPELLAEFARQMMSDEQWDEFLATREMNLAYMAPDADRFRVNVMFQRGSIGIVARRVVGDIPTMRQLGLPPVLRELALADRGIVLVTGSTGSGKSTTLASLIEYRNNLLTGHIVTIEDPVEFVYRHKRSIVTQREVGIDTKSFHDALKNTLRQAPQVILVGELRDAETVQFAMHASETGHLVFATLHSTNAMLTIERMLHFYPGEMKEQVLIQLSLNLKAIVCQRLVSRLGGGRVAAIELLINGPRLQDLIAKGDLSAIKQALNSENNVGLVNFDRALFKLCKQGRITVEDALQTADSANDLQIKFRGIGIEAGSSWQDVSDPWANIAGDYDFPESFNNMAKFRDTAAASGAYTNVGVKGLSTAVPAPRGADPSVPPPPQHQQPRPGPPQPQPQLSPPTTGAPRPGMQPPSRPQGPPPGGQGPPRPQGPPQGPPPQGPPRPGAQPVPGQPLPPRPAQPHLSPPTTGVPRPAVQAPPRPAPGGPPPFRPPVGAPIKPDDTQRIRGSLEDELDG